jgi:tetrahydromethanopterin S-methyltransferase subunit G
MAVMMSPREKWTDERLDDLDKKVGQGFADLRTEMREGFAQMDARFDKIDDRFERMQQALFAAAVAIIVALIGSTATLAGIALF